jgi:hypothetical protein
MITSRDASLVYPKMGKPSDGASLRPKLKIDTSNEPFLQVRPEGPASITRINLRNGAVRLALSRICIGADIDRMAALA